MPISFCPHDPDESPEGPKLATEQARRKVEGTVRELWFFLNFQLNQLGRNEAVAGHSHVNKLRAELEGYRRYMQREGRGQREGERLFLIFFNVAVVS